MHINNQKENFNSSTAVLFVTYNCDLEVFFKKILILSEKYLLIVVDNSDVFTFRPALERENVIFIANGINTGLCKAVNQGVEIARARNIQKVIYFDQDSDVSRELVERMINSHENISTFLPKVGVVGPYFIRPDREPYSIELTRKVLDHYYIVPETITSGMIFSVELFLASGGLSEALFLDIADHEFCWRLRKMGYSIVIDTSVTMVHSVGTSYLKIGSRSIPITPPLRNYYQMRNTVYLATRGKMIDPLFAFRKLCRRLIASIIMIAFAPQKLSRAYYYSVGFFDGIIGKLNKFDTKKT